MAHGYPDFEGNKVKLFTVAEWAALEGTDRDFYGSHVAADPNEYAEDSYTVPAGSTLYIEYVAGDCRATNVADADNNQIMGIDIYDETDDVYLLKLGGNGGAFANLTKPIRIAAEHKVYFDCYNYTNHVCNVRVVAAGYEL